MGPFYATREAVKAAAQSKTSRDDVSVDRALGAAVDSVYGLTHRRFAPSLETRSFRWPDRQGSAAEALWIDSEDLIELLEFTVDNGDTSLDVNDLFLEPNQYGPPYNRIEVNVGGNDVLSAGSTWQRAASALAWWGWTDEEEQAATSSAGLASTSTNALAVSDGSVIGVGSLLRVQDERLVVTGRSQVDTTATLSSDLSAQVNAQTAAVNNGTLVHVGETVLIGAEYLDVVDVAGSNLIVKRAANGSTIAAHASGTPIYAPRSLRVQRGAQGTAAAIHAGPVSVYRWVPPPLLEQYSVAEALSTLNQQTAGFAATAGSEGNEREVSGRALAALRKQVYDTYAIKGRTRAV